MSWLSSRRIAEPELMDDGAEVAAYASAAAAPHLAALDRSFVDHVERLIGRRPANELRGRALDFGCGPGQIPILMARRWPALRFVGIDAGARMIEQARASATDAGADVDFRVWRLGPDGEATLPFPDASFDLVTCNSVLHHLADPLGALNEIARVATPAGAVLVRDLVRPPTLVRPLHVRLFGRHYHGEMRRLYEASVDAAYTAGELRMMLARSRLNDGRSRIFERGRTHAGIERPSQSD